MLINDIRVYYFRLPFVTPIKVGALRLTDREGFLVSLSDEQGNTGYGEIAPLPGLDDTTLADCRQTLHEISSLVKSKGCESAVLKNAGMNLFNPAVSFGIESAILALRTGAGQKNECRPEEILKIAVNGLFVPNENRDHERIQADRLLEGGFTTIKVKIGRLPMDIEVRSIDYLMEKMGGTAVLRLDGNRLLSFEQYKRYYAQLNHLSVAYIEEPLASGDMERAGDVGWPLAIDESLPLYWDKLNLIFRGLPDNVTHAIVKPATPAGFADIMQCFTQNPDLQLQMTLSSAFNSIYGICSMALWAATVPGASRMVHGLGTGSFLKSDLASGFPGVKNGVLPVPIHLLWEKESPDFRLLEEIDL